MSALTTAESNGEGQQRRENPYDKQECATTWKEMCERVNKWGDAWEVWGNDVLSELDDLKKRVAQTQPTEPGPAPGDATKPPPSPFR